MQETDSGKKTGMRAEREREVGGKGVEWNQMKKANRCSVIVLLKRKYINISNGQCGKGTCELSDVHRAGP